MSKRRFQSTADVEARYAGRTPPSGPPPAPRIRRGRGWMIAGLIAFWVLGGIAVLALLS